MKKSGKYIAIGSGIKGLSHMTMESIAWIEAADIVCYCVSDPATVVWIKKNAKVEYDLYQCYGDDKRRIDTYHDMVDIMCGHVRDGKTVAGVFYGHPGLFCYPTHTAISRLREEGYDAVMLPGVSAVDCLFADAGFDPSMQGIQMVEATDLLLRKRSLMTDSHVVVWQIGCVGDIGFKFKGYDGRNFDTLMTYLYKFYPPETQVLHYHASIFPVCEPKVTWLPLSELPDDNVTGISTLYIPPLTKTKTDAAAGLELGLLRKSKDGKTGKTQYTAAPLPKPKPEEMNYYHSISGDNPIADFLNRMAADPALQMSFDDNPWVAMYGDTTLTQRQKGILSSRNSGAIRHAIKMHKPVRLPDPKDSDGVIPDDFAEQMSRFAHSIIR